MTFEDYLASVAPVRAAPTGQVIAEHIEIRQAATRLRELAEVSRESLAQLVASDPSVVRALGLAVGLGRERLRNQLRHRFDTSGWVTLAREHSGELIAMLDDEFGLVSVIEAERAKRFGFGDILVARAGSRQSAGEAVAGGRALEDAIEETVKRLNLPYELRTRFVGRSGDAPCDVAVPAGGAAAQIVCAAKGFDSTGSKLTDAVREIEQMAEVRLPTQFVYAVVDGIGWKSRQRDLKRIFALRESNQIDGLYTVAMLDRFVAELERAAAILEIKSG